MCEESLNYRNYSGILSQCFQYAHGELVEPWPRFHVRFILRQAQDERNRQFDTWVVTFFFKSLLRGIQETFRKAGWIPEELPFLFEFFILGWDNI